MVELRDGKVTLRSGSRLPGVSGASFVELVNVEVNGEYWLPAYQRTELQANFALFGDFRTLVRIVSRFREELAARAGFERAKDGARPRIGAGCEAQAASPAAGRAMPQ